MISKVKISECQCGDLIIPIYNPLPSEMLKEYEVNFLRFRKIEKIECGNWIANHLKHRCLEITFEKTKTHCIYSDSSYVYKKDNDNRYGIGDINKYLDQNKDQSFTIMEFGKLIFDKISDFKIIY